MDENLSWTLNWIFFFFLFFPSPLATHPREREREHTPIWSGNCTHISLLALLIYALSYDDGGRENWKGFVRFEIFLLIFFFSLRVRDYFSNEREWKIWESGNLRWKPACRDIYLLRISFAILNQISLKWRKRMVWTLWKFQAWKWKLNAQRDDNLSIFNKKNGFFSL